MENEICEVSSRNDDRMSENEAISFNADMMKDSVQKYVLWLDIMGIKEKMSRSLAQSSNFIAKFHAAIQRYSNGLGVVFPAMDGAYIIFDTSVDAKKFIGCFFQLISKTFMNDEHKHQFIVRAGLAHGRVYRCDDILPALSESDSKRLTSLSLIVGFAVIQAHLAEKEAPPFGVAIHESAREVMENGKTVFCGSWYRWAIALQWSQSLRHAMEDYFKWCREHYLEIGYDIKALERHELSAEQYFSPF